MVLVILLMQYLTKKGLMMIPKSVEELIHKYTCKITVKTVKDARKVILTVFCFSLCIFLSMKLFVFSAILVIAVIALLIFLTRLIKLNAVTIYDGVRVMLTVLASLVLFFNSGIYLLQVNTASSDAAALVMTLLLLVEVITMFAGAFSTFKQVKAGVIKKEIISGTSYMIYALSGIGGYFLAKSIVAVTSENISGFVITAFLGLCASGMMFCIGKAYLVSIYYIKKYKLTDKLIENDFLNNA